MACNPNTFMDQFKRITNYLKKRYINHSPIKGHIKDLPAAKGKKSFGDTTDVHS